MENEEKAEFKVISVRLPAQLVDLVEKIKTELGYTTSGVVQQAIRDMHKRTFPSYVAARNIAAAKTPEDRAEQQMEIARVKKQKEEEALLAIANALGGKIIVNDGGSKMVEFHNYSKNSRYLQKLPLRMMNEELVKDQYYPSRKDIEQRQVEGKVNYNPAS